MTDYELEIKKIKRMSDMEINEMYIKYKNGNTELRNTLIEQYSHLVVHIARKYNKIGNSDIEDLISQGYEIIIRSLDKYDISRGMKLGTFFYSCLEREYNNIYTFQTRKKRDFRNDISSNTVVYSGKDGSDIKIEDTFIDTSKTLEELIDDKELSIQMKKILKKFTSEEIELLDLRFGLLNGKSHTLTEIGDLKGLSHERIRQKEGILVKKLRHPNVTRVLKDFIN